MAPVAFPNSKHHSLPHKESRFPIRSVSFRWINRPTFLLLDSATSSPHWIAHSSFPISGSTPASPQRPHSAPNVLAPRQGRSSVSPTPQSQHLQLIIPRPSICIPPPRPPRPHDSLPNLRPKIILNPSNTLAEDFGLISPKPPRLQSPKLAEGCLNWLPEEWEDDEDQVTKIYPQSPLSPYLGSRPGSANPSPRPQYRNSFDDQEPFPELPTEPSIPTSQHLPSSPRLRGDERLHSCIEDSPALAEKGEHVVEIIEPKEKVIIAIEEAHHAGVWLDTKSWIFRKHRRALIFAAIISILLIAGGITAGLVVTLKDK